MISGRGVALFRDLADASHMRCRRQPSGHGCLASRHVGWTGQVALRLAYKSSSDAMRCLAGPINQGGKLWTGVGPKITTALAKVRMRACDFPTI